MGGSSRARCLVDLDACRLHGGNVSLNRMHRLVGPAGKLPITRLSKDYYVEFTMYRPPSSGSGLRPNAKRMVSQALRGIFSLGRKTKWKSLISQTVNRGSR
jgi:hypothetical protein